MLPEVFNYQFNEAYKVLLPITQIDEIDNFIYNQVQKSDMKDSKPEEKKTKDNFRKVTYSESSTFATCRKKWSFEYDMKIKRKVERHYFFAGSMLHLALEFFYLCRFYNYVVSTEELISFFEYFAWKEIEKARAKNPDKTTDIAELEHSVNVGKAILTEYSDNISKADDFKILSIDGKPMLETIFEVPILTPNGNPSTKFKRIGKIDGLVQLNGEVYLWENKFLASFDAGDVKWLNKDPQVISYIWAMEKQLGIKIAGAIYNVAKKSKLRLRKNDTQEMFQERIIQDYAKRPESYFERHCVWVSREDIENAPVAMYEMCKDMNNPRIYGTSTFICKRSGCVYQDLCLADSETYVEIMANEYEKKESAHEELM